MARDFVEAKHCGASPPGGKPPDTAGVVRMETAERMGRVFRLAQNVDSALRNAGYGQSTLSCRH